MSAHVEVWRTAGKYPKYPSGLRAWMWLCSHDGCPELGPGDFYPTHAEALQAALDHCARYPIKDRP